MRRGLLRWLTPLVVTGFGGLPLAQAQAPAAAEGGSAAVVAVSYLVAFLSTAAVLAILCTPSRKRPSQ